MYKKEKYSQIYLPDGVYDDLLGNVEQGRPNAVSPPTIRMWNHGIGGGVTFPTSGFAVGNDVFLIFQSKHQMKLSSILKDHIHFSTPTNDVGKKFKFQIDVIAAVYNGQFAVPAGSPFTAEYTLLAADLGYHRILDLGSIPAVNTTVSTLYKIKLSRINASADEYGGEVYVEFNDCHFLIDDIGSINETSKV
jgi:hypothetical protein